MPYLKATPTQKAIVVQYAAIWLPYKKCQQAGARGIVDKYKRATMKVFLRMSILHSNRKNFPT